MANVWVVGGRGTGADKSDTNGGGFVKDSARSWADFQGANAGPIDTATGATISDNGSGSIRLTSTGNFSNSLVDVLVYCDFTATYTDGHYAITAVDASGNYIDIDLAYSAITTANVNVGGALATIDYGVNRVSDADDLKISQGPYTTLNANDYLLECVNWVTGADNNETMRNNIKIFGVENDDGEPDYTSPLLLDGQGLGGSKGVRVLSNYQFHNIHVDDPDSGDCFDSTGGMDRVIYYRCKATNGARGFTGDDQCSAIGCVSHSNSSHGFEFDNDTFISACEAYSNGGVGIDSDGNARYIGNRSYNNVGGQIQGNYGFFTYNIAWDSVNDSVFMLNFDEQNPYTTFVYGNILNGKGRTGSIGVKCYTITPPASVPLIMNNVILNCAVGVSAGNTFNGQAVYANNSFYGNVTDRNANAEGQKLSEITSAPLFTDESNNDYTLQATSPLREEGLDWALASGLTSNLIAIGYYNSSEATEGGGSPLIISSNANRIGVMEV